MICDGGGMKVLPLVIAGFILGGCAAEGGVLSEVQEAAADLFLPPEQAAQLGARMAQEIEAKQPLHPSAELQARVARLGERVLAQAGEVPQAYDFSFKAIENPDTVNAFALPGGQIYVTSGLVELAGTDAQRRSARTPARSASSSARCCSRASCSSTRATRSCRPIA